MHTTTTQADASRQLLHHRDELASRLMDLLAPGETPARHPPDRDAILRTLTHLTDALHFGRPPMFVDFERWAGSVPVERGGSGPEGPRRLTALREAVARALSGEAAHAAVECIDSAQEALSHAEPPRAVGEWRALPAAQEFLACVLQGEPDRAVELVCALDISIEDLYLRVLQPALHDTGRLWQVSGISVAQEHFVTATVQQVLARRGAMPAAAPDAHRIAVCACVAGEWHDMGLRFVADLMQRAGWRTIFLGANNPGADLLSLAIEHRADLVALSATSVPAAREVQALIAGLRALPECARMRVMVGGTPFIRYEGLSQQVGADGCAPDAALAVQLARELVPV